MNGRLDPVLMDLAISQLGGSTAGGPKMLKVVTKSSWCGVEKSLGPSWG